MYALAISALIKTFDPDIIILSSDFPSYFLDVLPSHSVKIISMHNTFWRPYGQPASLKNKIINVVRKLALRNTNFAVCVSSECQRQFQIIRSNPSVFSVVQIPRITEQFQEKSDISPRNMLFVGRIEIEKGIEDLIYAFRMLKHDLPDINLKVIGDGNALEYLRGLALTLGLKSDIDFTGRLNALEVGRSYAEADLCICPTHWSFNEGLATVPLEAASYGVPTIMSHAVPAKEQFGSGAITFEPGNIDDLADKIRYAILDERAFQNARKDARESFARTMADTRDWKAGIHSCLNKLPKHRS
jgi:glycosyltransferase involved in cell wall biosynthesis